MQDTANRYLENDDAESVRVVVPPLRIDLLVQADDVQAKRSKCLEVKLQRRIRRGGVQAIGPEALIKPR